LKKNLLEKEKIEDLSEKGLKEFYDSKLEEYKTDIAPLIDNKTEIFKPNGKVSVDPADMTKAENNELLEEDYNPYN
jgi:ElaB/YqjD/DUF883 family membrane-anchored ribosome-binding protein